MLSSRVNNGPIISVVLFLSLSFTGKGVTNFRRSRVTSILSWENFAGNSSRVNWKDVVQLEKKPWVKDTVEIKSSFNLIPGSWKRDGAKRSQLGRAEKKAKGKQHWGPLATAKMDWIMVNSNQNSNTELMPTYFLLLN